MAIKTYQAFTPPSPYEMERRKAEQQRRYAELLQEQAMAEDEPFTYQGFRAMPSPAAALGKLLKIYGSKKAGEKAEEAEQRAREADIEGAERLRRELAPETRIAAPTGAEIAGTMGTPQINEEGQLSYGPSVQAPLRTEMVGPTAKERQNIFANYAVSGTPTAQRLAQVLASQEPQTKTMEFGGRLLNISDGTATPVMMGGAEIAEPTKPRTRISSDDLGDRVRVYFSDGTYEDVSKRTAPGSGGSEPLHIVDVNGVPTYVSRSQAAGKKAFVAKPAGGLTGEDKVDRRKHRETRIQLQNAYDSIGEFAKELQNTPKEASLYGEAAGRLSSKYKLALGAVRVLQNTGVLNPGELPFIEDTLRNPQSLTQLFNPASRETIAGQVNSIADLLEKQSATNDELFEYDITPLKGRDWRASSIPAKAKAAGLTQADWDAATEEERAAWR